MSLTTLGLTQLAPAWRGHGGRNGVYTWTSEFNLLETDTNVDFLILHTFLRILKMDKKWQIDHIGHLLPWKGQLEIHSDRNRYAGKCFVFPDCRIHFYETFHEYDIRAGDNFRAKKIAEWDHEQGSYHIPHHPKAAGMTEQWNSVKFIAEVVVWRWYNLRMEDHPLGCNNKVYTLN